MTYNFGNNLKLIRIYRGMTKNQLAQEIKVMESTIHGYEERGMEPRLSILIKLAKVLKTNIDDLVFTEGTDIIHLNEKS